MENEKVEQRKVSNSGAVQYDLFSQDFNEPIKNGKPKQGRVYTGRGGTAADTTRDGSGTSTSSWGGRIKDLIGKIEGEGVNKQNLNLLSEALFEIKGEYKEVVPRKEWESFREQALPLLEQFEEGGVEKKGRGVLDEYYTPKGMVDAVGMILQKIIPNRDKTLEVLEPSVGTGNFLRAVKYAKTKVTGYEVNLVSATLAKAAHPNLTVFNTPLETLFITESGHKKEFAQSYDVIIGNPPYGQHRGLYKGLGEETNISRYEDYFVKRGMDLLKEGGILAMVLPHGWINRARKIKNV